MLKISTAPTPPPFAILSRVEMQALWTWRQRWGAIWSTREPEEGKTLLRPFPVRVPLIECSPRPTYDRVLFTRWWAGRVDR